MSSYSHTNVHEEREDGSFYKELSITRQVPKHHDLIFDGDFNARHLTNRKSIMVKNFMEERDLSCLNMSS